ncbi:hypothetical protein K469DRAFT_745133 [Zopfia rhizophila CBS 207.26]|uniref:Peptidase S1 domain-containing protein n=1 Tax=Zopfia rhizophila CBS 207.26 TaxID=1314779 RepID=A0A6A6ERG4_9PEZI|nr:hypothetical protein K469DRAFT_745133 [Zopfia rhizophila CBS 207.26]
MSPQNDLAAWFLQGPDFLQNKMGFPESIEEDTVYPEDKSFGYHNLTKDYKDNGDYEETVHDRLPYKRSRVEDIHFAEQGKYRAILKLKNYFVKWEGDKTQYKVRCQKGTGWLMDDTEVATAGHCVYHKDFGHLISTQIYLGFKNDASVDMRYGHRVVVPYRFLLQTNQPEDDLAVIHFDKPFEKVTPIKWVPTPQKGNINLTVVGYPGDLSNGMFMYEGSQRDVNVDVANEKNNMLAYLIDTFGANRPLCPQLESMCQVWVKYTHAQVRNVKSSTEP